jgi:hypothetical protein
MNSSPSRLVAAAGSSAASAGRSKNPAVLSAAALAALNDSSVLAAPQADSRKSRRPRPRLLGQVVGEPVRTVERDRLELAVRRGIELDRQTLAVRIDAMSAP